MRDRGIQTAKSGRQANFELLRILAMFMVVIMHYISRSQALPEYGRELDSVAVTAVFLESFCLVAVNVYVLLSGYFLSAAAFSWKRLLRLYLQVLFYTVFIPVVLVLLGLLPLSEISYFYFLVEMFLPGLSGQYWFVTAYILMCLFAPFLNEALERLPKKRLEQLLAALLFYFCLGKTFLPMPLPMDKMGYDFGWFLVLYVIGGYIRRYGIPFLKNGRRGLWVYLGAMGLNGILECVTVFLYRRTGMAGNYTLSAIFGDCASALFHYNHLLCLTGAVGLFSAFSCLRIKEGRFSAGIRFVSPAVFGVYLIHEQQNVGRRWFGWVNALTGKIGPFWKQEAGEFPNGVFGFLTLLLVHTLLVFFVCIIIDKIRGTVFNRIERAIQSHRR